MEKNGKRSLFGFEKNPEIQTEAGSGGKKLMLDRTAGESEKAGDGA